MLEASKIDIAQLSYIKLLWFLQLFNFKVFVMNKILVLMVVTIISGCGQRLIQPQMFGDIDNINASTPMILNNYPYNDFFYLITHVDNESVGDSMRGSPRINEIYASPGSHVFDVIAHFIPGSSWQAAYERTFKGKIQCEFEIGYSYTISPAENGSPLHDATVNSLPSFTVGDTYFYATQPKKGAPLKAACIKHPVKPVNTELLKTSEKYGFTITNEPYKSNK